MESRRTLWRRLRGRGGGGGNEGAGREVGRLRSEGGLIGISAGARVAGVAVNAVVGRGGSGDVASGSGRHSGGGRVWGRVISRILSCVGISGARTGTRAIVDSGAIADAESTTDTEERVVEGTTEHGGDEGGRTGGAAVDGERERSGEGRRRGRERERDRERLRGRGFRRRNRIRDGRSFGSGPRGLEDMDFLTVMNRVFEEYREREWERERNGFGIEGGGGFWETSASGMLAGVERARALEEMLEAMPTFVIEKGGVEAAERLFGVLREGTGRVDSVEDIVEVLEGANHVKEADVRDGECVICLGSYEVGDEVLILPCIPRQHYFHAECIRPWVRKTGDCPCCRSQIDTWKAQGNSSNERTERRTRLSSSRS